MAATAGGVRPASATLPIQAAIAFGIPRMRVFDTRTGTGEITAMSSSSALTSKNRLRKGA